MASTLPKVPPGFEDIAAGQVEHLDIRLLGTSLGVFPVFVRPDDVRLETPEAVARAIHDRLGTEANTGTPIPLVDALARPMVRNGHLACTSGNMSGSTGESPGVDARCRYLETESVDVIFDESQGALELFLAKAWLPSQSAAGPSHHTNSPGSEPALIHTQIVNVSTTDRYRNLTVLGNGALGVSPASYAGFTWSLVHTSHSGRREPAVASSAEPSGSTQALIDSLYYRHDVGAAHYVQAGRMDQRNLYSAQGGSFGFTLLPVGRFDGVRVGTSQAYVNDASRAQGSPLTVLLTRDARVDAYRGNELLGSAYFQAGVQSFDTRYFPEGAYLVSLRIFEGDTLVRTETEPFTKVGGEGTGDDVQWFLQTGRTVNRRQSDVDEGRARPTVQSGVRKSLPFGMTFTSGLVWLPSRLYNESQINWQRAFSFGQLTAATSVLFGTDGARGTTQSISLSNGIGLSLYRYQMRDASCRGGVHAATRSDIQIGCYDSINAYVSMPLGRWQGSAGYSQSQNYGRRHVDFSSPQYDDVWPRNTTRSGVSRTLQVTLSRSFRWKKLAINSRVGGYHRRHANEGRPDTGTFVNVSLSAQRPAAPGRNGATFSSVSVDVRSDRYDDRRMRAAIHAQHSWMWDDTSRRELTVGLTGDEASMASAHVRGAIEGRYGDVHAMLSRSFRGADAGSDRGSFTGGYASSIAATRDRLWFGPAMLAGDPPAGVGLIVEADNAHEAHDAHDDHDDHERAMHGAAATLQVGGRPLTVDFGAAALSPIGGYRAQQGEVFEARQDVTDYSVGLLRGAGVRDYFLTPGRMKVHRVTAGRSYTYVGQARGPDGLSLANARVLSVSAPPLDDRGEFLIESPRPLTELYLLDRGQPMRCNLTVVERRDVIHLNGVTPCNIVTQHALPASLQAQAHVQRLLSDAKEQADQHAATARDIGRWGDEGR